MSNFVSILYQKTNSRPLNWMKSVSEFPQDPHILDKNIQILKVFIKEDCNKSCCVLYFIYNSLTECYYTFNYKNHWDPGLFTCYALLLY